MRTPASAWVAVRPNCGKMSAMNENREAHVAERGTFSFGRYRPRASLSPFIRNYWVLGPTVRPNTPTRLRIVPDGFTDLIFVRHSPSETFQASVVGTMTKPILKELGGHVEYVGVRFAPGGLTGLFGVPVDELTDRIMPLESLVKRFVPMDRVADGVDIGARLAILEDAFERHPVSREHDPALAKVVETIFAHRGVVSVAQLARIAGWSPRHLRRIFCGLVGVGPKTFCRIVRFKTALRMLRRGHRPDLLNVALEAGYYDQAHFIHEFNAFYGAGPSAARKDRVS
jgi:AraC-like DNA-binding protein